MALVTVQRSPSPSDTPDNLSSDHGDGAIELDSSSKSPKRSQRYLQTRKRFRKCLTGIRFVSRLRLSESYLSFKGAALILPQSECLRTVTKGTNVDIQVHLQSMFCLLRPQDTIKMAIKLDSPDESWIRYMAVVTTTGVQDTEESVIIGVDIDKDDATIGMVLAVWGDTVIKLNGDGGFHITSNQVQYIFKPVSVQAMWSAWQCLNKIRDYASVNSYYVSGLTHTWIQYYKVTSTQQKMNIWNLMEDLESQRPETLSSSEAECVETQVKTKLRVIMMTVDLEEATSKLLRTKLEEELNMSLQEYKHFVDQEMIVIMRQMDAPSQIFDYVYLGSEWNASNLDELQKNGVGYILNVTREIDNFFPGIFHYKNIRVYDVDESDLLRYWEDTYKFINKARRNKSKVLVHCKMGVSRSASTVISFAMKDNGWSLDEALKYVKGRRGIINPNAGFMKQLKTYEGILGASNQRHNKLWRSSSVGDMEPTQERDEDSETYFSDHQRVRMGTRHDSYPSSMGRNQSWSLSDDAADELIKDADNGACESSGTESLDASFDDAQSEPVQFLLGVDPDTSSQSVDDWDEVLRENTEAEAISKNAGIVLLGHKSRQYSVESDGEQDDSLSEEGEEGAEEDVDTSRAAGSYDVEVLDSAQDFFLFNQDRGMSGVAFNLHPDMILEYVLSNHRRQRMTRHVQLHKRPQESEPIDIKQEQKAPITTGTRVKADNSWIKEEVPTECTEDQPCPSRAEQDSLCVQGERPTSGSSPGSELTGEEMSLSEGAMEPYIKEAIPWSPGSVRRHAQDLECRMTTVEIPITDNPLPNQSTSRAESATPELSGSPDSTNTPPMPSDQRLSSSTQDNSSAPKTGGAVAQPGTPPSSHRLMTGSPKPTTQPSDQRPYSLQLSSPDSVHSESSHLSDSASTLSTPLDSPSLSPQRDSLQPESVHNMGDIQFVPGHVLRTRLEMEERERSPQKESRPVQRSASYKQYKEANRGRFDRTDDRRKTCLPVLTTRASEERCLSTTKSLDDVSLTVPLDLEQLKLDSDQGVAKYSTEEGQVQSRSSDAPSD